jgi:murein DD-endopeptidase MepM/ murein hydrolase activator NlpD
VRPEAPHRFPSGWRCATRPLIALVALAVLASPAAAQQPADPEAKQQANQERQRAVDAQINAATASEEQLRVELARLDGEVAAGEERTAAARARQAQAESQVAVLRTQVTEAEAAAVDARKKAAEQAVNAYMRPDRESATALLAARDPQQLSKMKALVGEVAQHNHAIIQGRVAAEGLLRQKKADGEQAQAQAEQASAQAQAELAATTDHRAQQASVRDEVLRRISGLRGEQAALDAEEAQITTIIADRRRKLESDAKAKADADARAAAAQSAPPAANAVPGKISGSGLIWPAKGTVSSGFGARWGTVHKGLDIAAPTGTPIWAAKAGEVIYAGEMSGYGNVVIVDHGGGMSTLYGHQSRIASSVGQQVAQGQVIGYVGSTGNSTGPHLHFEVRIGDTPRDPVPYLP